MLKQSNHLKQINNNNDNESAVERFSLIVFLISVLFIAFSYGFVAARFRIFPYQFYQQASEGVDKLLEDTGIRLPLYYKRLESPYPEAIYNTDRANKGLRLVTKMAANRTLSAEIIDLDGNKLHEWNVDWFRIWPNPQHLPDSLIPKSKPGTKIHGAVVMENGDLVFNFEERGLVRLNLEGEVVWRLPYITHHSLHLHDDGNFWVSGQKRHFEPDPRFPNRKPPFIEYTILEVSPEGKILSEYSIPDILNKNGYSGLLSLGTIENRSTDIKGDVLHANDVEPFPLTLEEGFFNRGDVMVSARNINTVFVFNKDSEEIKFMAAGLFVRQHDPDFIDGNTFSVFDNNNIAPESAGPQSRILTVSAIDNKTTEVFFEGTSETPFFTNIGGKHQWLPNGNLLITSFSDGRGFEVNREGEIVWEYYNYVDSGMVGVVSEVQHLPLEYESIFRK